MAQLIFVEFYNGKEKIKGIDMTWRWRIQLLPKSLKFEKVHFAGEIDDHAEITLPILKEIYFDQIDNGKPTNESGIGYENTEELKYYMRNPELYDQVKIVLYQWSSG
jgi:secreted protein with Ig-like and vWFA domain